MKTNLTITIEESTTLTKCVKILKGVAAVVNVTASGIVIYNFYKINNDSIKNWFNVRKNREE